MVSQSASGSLDQREPAADSLMDSVGSEDTSIDPKHTSIDGDGDSECGKVVRLSSDDVQVNNEESLLSHSSSNESGKVVRLSSDDVQFNNEGRPQESLLSHSSSNDSSETEFTRDSDAGLSIIYAVSHDEMEDVLEMGCMDFVFLPQNAKPKPTRQLFKFNKKGKKELNINVKGPLALGLEAKMKEEAEKGAVKTAMSFGSVLQGSVSCGNSRVLEGISSGTKLLHYEDKSVREEREFGSIMSLSHGSSEEEDCDNSVIPENLVLPPPVQSFQNQGQPQQQHPQASLMQQQQHQNYYQHQFQGQDYHPSYDHMNQQQQMNPHGINLNGNISNHKTQDIQQFPNMMNGAMLRSPLGISSMPSHISVGEESAFEEGSYLSYDVKVGPDPPPSSSLAKIEEGDYPELSSGESESSMVACGSTISETQDNPSFDKPQKSTPKKGGKLSKVHRWRKANNQRLKKNQPRVNSTPSIKEENGEDHNSVDSDQATYSSESTSSVRNAKGSKNEALVQNCSTPKGADGQSLAFDSIFTRRLQKRRAAKLRKNGSQEKALDTKSDSESMQYAAKLDKKSSDEKPFDVKSNSSVDNDKLASRIPSSQNKGRNSRDESSKKKSNSVSRKGFKEVSKNSAAAQEMPRNNIVVNIDSESSDGIPEPPYDPFVIDAVAAAAAAALNKDYTPMQKPPSFDNEDTENRVPHPAIKGKEQTADAKPMKAETPKSETSDADAIPRKNPFQDDDIFEEDEGYDDEAYAYPLLTKSSSDHEDIFKPVVQPNTPSGTRSSPFHSARSGSSPLASRSIFVPMTPSPRHSSRPVVSPRHYKQWNGSMHSLSNRMAAATLEKCPSGEVKRTDSIKCSDSIDESEFFESHMYSN